MTVKLELVPKPALQMVGTVGLKGEKGDTGSVGPQGPQGLPGLNGGADGWSPVLAVVQDSSRNVLQVTDWTGGTSAKPATGGYVGPSGLVANIANATDIRGATGAQGPQGIQGPTGATGPQGIQGPAGTIGTNSVDNTELAQMPANTLKGNNTGSTANASDLTASQVKTLLAQNSDKIDSQDLTNQASVTISLPSQYKAFKLLIRKCKMSVDAVMYIRMQVGATLYASSGNYSWGGRYGSQGSAGEYSSTSSGLTSVIAISPGNVAATAPGFLSEVTIEPGSASFNPQVLFATHMIVMTGTVGASWFNGAGYLGAQARITAIQLLPTSGQFTNIAYELSGVL